MSFPPACQMTQSVKRLQTDTFETEKSDRDKYLQKRLAC